MKYSPRPLFLLHYALRQIVFSWHPLNLASSVGLPDGEASFTTPENAFPLLQSPVAVSINPLQLTLGIAHGDLRLVCGYSAMENHFMKLPINSSYFDFASRGLGFISFFNSSLSHPVFLLWLLWTWNRHYSVVRALIKERRQPLIIHQNRHEMTSRSCMDIMSRLCFLSDSTYYAVQSLQ